MRYQQIFTFTKFPITKTCTETFTTKNWKFTVKHSDILHISAQNIDCTYSLEPHRRGGSNEFPQSMFLGRNKKKYVSPCKPHFYYIKWGLRGSKLYRHVFVMHEMKLRVKGSVAGLVWTPQISNESAIASSDSQIKLLKLKYTIGAWNCIFLSLCCPPVQCDNLDPLLSVKVPGIPWIHCYPLKHLEHLGSTAIR